MKETENVPFDSLPPLIRGLFLTKKQEEKLKEPFKDVVSVVRCKDCENWIPGYITDKDDFIPPKCGKYQQMVGHSADDYCSLAERKEGR